MSKPLTQYRVNFEADIVKVLKNGGITARTCSGYVGFESDQPYEVLNGPSMEPHVGGAVLQFVRDKKSPAGWHVQKVRFEIVNPE